MSWDILIGFTPPTVLLIVYLLNNRKIDTAKSITEASDCLDKIEKASKVVDVLNTLEQAMYMHKRRVISEYEIKYYLFGTIKALSERTENMEYMNNRSKDYEYLLKYIKKKIK